ncbi:class F sortase [Candidatus Microgenomates bacterium]|nr:class F sortase [Candidatus Microgenomates bacterium]
MQIDTAIETVGNDEKGRMDVPKEATNAGWYEPGFKPGMLGSAVIAAHYDTPLGAPGPFYNLGKLEPGDIIETEDVNGAILKFKVIGKKTHKDADFPIKEVFAQSDQKRLNLITCSGTWSKDAKNYSDRLVVYAVLQ